MKQTNPIKASLWQNGVCVSEGIDLYDGSDWGYAELDTHKNESPMMNYTYKPETLKCKCYRCDKEVTPVSQYYDYGSEKYLIMVNCHNETTTLKLTEKEINTVNEQGVYYVFMQ